VLPRALCSLPAPSSAPDIPILKPAKAEYAKLQLLLALSCGDSTKRGGQDEARTGAEDCLGFSGIVVHGCGHSANNVFLAGACGANDNEHLCDARNFLAVDLVTTLQRSHERLRRGAAILKLIYPARVKDDSGAHSHIAIIAVFWRQAVHPKRRGSDYDFSFYNRFFWVSYNAITVPVDSTLPSARTSVTTGTGST
jgi:hypothetical protein